MTVIYRVGKDGASIRNAVPQKPTGEGPYIGFGRWVREQRERHRFRSQLSSERRAKELGLRVINQGKLSHLERGWNSNPEPELLREVAAFIRVPYPVVVQEWVKHRFGISMADIEGAIVDRAREVEGLDPIDLAVARRYHNTTDYRLREVVERALDVKTRTSQGGGVKRERDTPPPFPARRAGGRKTKDD